MPTWAVYFTVYNHVKGVLVKWTGKDESLIHMASAMSAGACTNVLTNPIWVIKTRYQTQSMSGRNNIQYSGLISGLLKIGREEGLRGLYKGLVPSLGTLRLDFTFRISQYATKSGYNSRRSAVSSLREIKERVCYHEYVFFFTVAKMHSLANRPVDELGALSLIASSAISKMIASVVAYPHEVIRSR